MDWKLCSTNNSKLDRILQDHPSYTSGYQRANHTLDHLLRPLRPRADSRTDPTERQAVRPAQVLRLRTQRIHDAQAEDQAQAPDHRCP